MKIYFAGNGEGSLGDMTKFDYSLVCSYFIDKRLLSFYNVSKINNVQKEYLNAMKLYFAGGENKSWLEAIERAGGWKSLYSFFGLMKNSDSLTTYSESQKEIFLDSGAFSAFTKGVVINIDEYIEFIKKNKKYIKTYSNLDVIGNEKATIKNQRYMEKKGLGPLPVFHHGESFDYLKSLVSEYDYLALGGIVPLSKDKDKMRRHLSRCFSIIRDKTRVHGFGVTGIDILKEYPFYSVDSTSWLGGSMRSEIYTFDMGNMNIDFTGSKDICTLRTFSFTDQPEQKKWFYRVINNCIEWMKFEQFITELWKERGVEWDD